MLRLTYFERGAGATVELLTLGPSLLGSPQSDIVFTPVGGASAAAPEPATLALAGMGLLPVAGVVIRKRRNAKT